MGTQGSSAGSGPIGATVTILFSDIRGFTEYTNQYGDEAAFQVLQEHNAVVRKQIEAFGGHVVKTQGDSFMVAFSTARGAMQCAAAIQRAVAALNQDQTGSRLAVGIGINTGEPIHEGGDFFGSTVNLAARICAAAGPGQVLISETTRQVAGRLDGLELVDCGIHELKGFDEPQHLFEVVWAPSPGGDESKPDETEVALLEAAVQRAVGVLNRVLAIEHVEDPAFRPLVECQARAGELRQALVRAAAEQRGFTPRKVDQAMLPFADLLALITDRDQLSDERWEQLEAAVTRIFGRPLVVAATRGRLHLPGGREAPRRAAATSGSAPAPPPRDVASAPAGRPAPAGAPPPPEPAPAPAAAAGAPGPDPRAQGIVWWSRAHAGWHAWKASGMAYAHANRMALARHPYLLSVPILESAAHDGGGLAETYFPLLQHVESVAPGFLRNAVDKALQATGGSTDPQVFGRALYALLVILGRLRDTYADFIRDIMVATIPVPGPWVDVAIVETEDATAVVTRPSAAVGDSNESRLDLTAPAERAQERRFALTLAPLTARFLRLRAREVKSPRQVDVRLAQAGQPSDRAWCVQLRPDHLPFAPPKRVSSGALSLPGFGRGFIDCWVGVFNPEADAAITYEVDIGLRSENQPGPRRSSFAAGHGPR